MKRLATIVTFGATLCVFWVGWSATALADDGLPEPPPAIEADSAVNPISIVSGSGMVVGEGTVFHPQIGIETGIISNVFYTQNQPVMAGLLRIIGEIGTGSLPRQRLMAKAAESTTDDTTAAAGLTPTTSSIGNFQYSADLYASWDQYLSTNDAVTAQGGLGGGLLLRGIVNQQHPLQFAFQEHFNRVIRASNFESTADTNRDINTLDLRLNYVPYGRSVDGYLYYENLLDLFESSSQQFANRMHNTFGLHANWRWLPLTQVYADVSWGVFTGIGSSQKVNSYPLTAIAGISTALTLYTTVNVHAGYSNGFYASGPNYSNVTAGAQFGYRYSPLGRILFLYDYSNQDSINANFYRDHLFQITLETTSCRSSCSRAPS